MDSSIIKHTLGQLESQLGQAREAKSEMEAHVLGDRSSDPDAGEIFDPASPPISKTAGRSSTQGHSARFSVTPSGRFRQLRCTFTSASPQETRTYTVAP